MNKLKSLSVVAIAAAAVFMGPAAANASIEYPGEADVIVVGTPGPGETVVVDIEAGAFIAGEDVSFAVTGATAVTLAAAGQQTTTLVKTADADGGASVDVTLPADATGTYNISATGLESGQVESAALTVVAADAGAGAGAGAGSGSGSGDSADDLAYTGAGDATMLLVWAGAGALLLGGALVVVMTTVRRQRANS
ncbi:hypothetical protein [Marisediminicola sp. LYQ85]|uniref:hypothetical protein n=1 Tax=Marisediminicola sp. LYQ85 TaxID=3391062 RepID=UPI003983462B